MIYLLLKDIMVLPIMPTANICYLIFILSKQCRLTYRQNHSRRIGIWFKFTTSFAEIHAERSRSKTVWRLRCREERERENKREAIGNGNGYLAKTKLDFYGGQVLIKFRKLEENLSERGTATSRNPPPTLAFSDFPLSPIGFNPYTRSFSHFPLWNRMLGKLDK